MEEQVLDYRLHDFYKRIINAFPEADGKLLAQRHCMEVPISVRGLGNLAVGIVANKKYARVVGTTRCSSSWACPVCSSINMSKYASDIAAAIDALENKKQWGFMLTLTIPHTRQFPCKMTFDILQRTWFLFDKHATVKSRTFDTLVQFCAEFNCKHRVRCAEFTFGRNGWHPHYHCIWFVDKSKFQSVADWQEKLSQKWRKCARQATIYIMKKYDFVPNPEKWCDDHFHNEKYYKQRDAEGMPDAYISRNKDGSVRRVKSSDYICGWGADSEVTGLTHKTAKKGHLSPYQMLEKAYEINKTKKTPLQKNIWAWRYLQFALATYSKYRIRFSKELRTIIEEHKQTADYILARKKKDTERFQDVGEFRLVAWFSPEQWLDICLLNRTICIIPHLLKLAMLDDATNQIRFFLLNYDIDISQNRDDERMKFLMGLTKQMQNFTDAA